MAPPSTTKKFSPSPSTVLKHGIRRPQPINTKISSYHRTDPFHAIDTFRKLIYSLPCRGGGFQYKLTPDEHKLSLHLLTIIEPFIGISPSPGRRTLTRQPTEILDAIVFHVDSKRDLLALALSCHRLHSVIFPRHYDYRVICAKASSISLWNHLIVHSALARNVRMLEIVDERSPKALILPTDITKTDADFESSDDELKPHSKQTGLLVSALSGMTTLQSFHWSCNHSIMSMDDIWATLTKRQTLSEITISDNFMFLPNALDGGTGKPVDPEPNSVLPDLKAIAFQATKHAFGSTKTPSLNRIFSMLTNCPNLESLDIHYEHRRGQGQQLPTTDDFFLCSRLPTLRSLSLGNVRCSSAYSLQLASIFLAAHCNLEVLHLDLPLNRSTSATGSGIGTTPTLVLPPNALPKLRELKCGKAIATAILSSPVDTPRPLEVLQGITLTGPEWDGPFLASLRLCGDSVRRIRLAGWQDLDDIKRLVECVSRLTWLDVSKYKGTHTQERAAKSQGVRRRDLSLGKVATVYNLNVEMGATTNVLEWAAVLAPLTELTTLVGVKFFYEVSTQALSALGTSSSTSLSPSELSRIRKNDMVAGVLGNKCPRLKRLDHWDDNSGKAIVLSRDGRDINWDVKRLKM